MAIKLDSSNIKLTAAEIDRALGFWGLPESKKSTLQTTLTPYQKLFIKHLDDFSNYKIIARVIFARHCALGAKVGGQITFSGFGEIIPEECNAVREYAGLRGYCSFAVQMMRPYILAIQDRIMSDCEDPSPMGIDTVKCIDTEPALGGTGETRYRLYVIREKVKIPRGMYRAKVKIA